MIERENENGEVVIEELDNEEIDSLWEHPSFQELVRNASAYFDDSSKLKQIIYMLERCLEKEEERGPSYDITNFISDFIFNEELTKRESEQLGSGFGNMGLTLLVLRDYFVDNEFKLFNPLDLPSVQHIQDTREFYGYVTPRSKKIAVDMNDEIHSVSTANCVFMENADGDRFVVFYMMDPQGNFIFEVTAENSNLCTAFVKKLKTDIMRSKYLLGNIIEITEGSDFKVVKINEHELPALDETLDAELSKEILNVFDNAERFHAHNLPLRRSVLIAGIPGSGKTSYCRWVANRLRGKVTTLWVTSKSIQHSSHVAQIFETARMLSPVLLVLEDLDLYSAERQSMFRESSNILGELLNCLDGLNNNDKLVMIGTTNRLSSLDDAIKNRPGRIDKIFELNQPSANVALLIAHDYLLKHNISKEALAHLDLNFITTEGYSGAYIVEIVKGALIDAIHRNRPLDNIMLIKSKNDMDRQRKLIMGGTSGK